MKRLTALMLALAMMISVFAPNLSAAYMETMAEDASSIAEEAADASSLRDSQSEAEEDRSASNPEAEAEQSASDPEASASAEPEGGESSDVQKPQGQKAKKAETSRKQKTPKQGIYGKNFDPKQQAPELKHLKKTLKTVDGVTYRLTVSYDKNAGIPDDAKLSVVELNQALTEEELEKKENKKRPCDTERFVSEKALEQDTFDLQQGLKVRKKDYVLFTKFLDLSLTADGKEVQPKAPVTVTLETDVVEEGASDALEAAVLDETATEQWQKRREKLVRKQEEQLKSGKLKEKDAKRFHERVFRSLKVTNETKKKKGTRVSFRLKEFTRLGVAGVAKRLKSWKVKGETVCVYGPRGLKAKVRKETLKTPKAGMEKVRAFSVKPNEKKNPGYDVTFWVGGVPEQYKTTQADAAQADAAKDDAAQDDTAKDDAAQDDTAKDDAAQDDTAKDDAAKDDAAQDDTAKDDAAQDNAAQDDTAKDDTAKDNAALSTMSDEEPDTGVVVSELKRGGRTGRTLIGIGGSSAPVAIQSGKSVGLLWDTGLRAQSVEAEQVSVEGLLPKNAQVSAEDMLWRYSRPEEVVEDVGEEAETLAAYDITISGRQGEFQPDKGESVSVSIRDESISSRKKLEVWHLKDDGSVEVIRDFTVKGDTLSFEAEGFSVYMVVQVSKEQVVTASDGKSYKITVLYDADAGIPEDAELQVSELDSEGKDYQKYVKKAAKKLDSDVKDFYFAHAFDIALVNPETGEHYQPTKNVTVRARLLKEDVSEDSNLSVVHFGEETEVLESSVKGESVEFETNGFSVYVIIDHEGGEIITPRVEFHFLSQNFTENGDTTFTAPPYEFINTAPNHSTSGKPTNVQTSQILADTEKLENIANPPNLITYDTDGTTVLSSKYFFGWYLVDDVRENSAATPVTYTYKWDNEPEQLHLEKALTISNVQWNTKHTAVSSLTWTMDGISHTVEASKNNTTTNHIELDETGCAHVFLAPIYEDYYFVNFHLGAKETAKDKHDAWDRTGLWSNLMTRRLIVLGDDGRTEVNIGLPAPPTDTKRQVFAGWESVNVEPINEIVDGQPVTINYPKTRKKLYESVNPVTGEEKNSAGHTDGYYITVKRDDSITGDADEIMNANKSVDLYPVFAEARWIYFDIGKSGNGATYVGAKYLLTSDNIPDSTYCLDKLPGKGAHTHQETVDGVLTTIVDDSAVQRSGYAFKGWYYGAVRDADGNIANLTSSYNYIDDEGHSVTVPRATKITDENGTLINGEIKNNSNETIFKIEGGKLYVYKALEELNLFANWEEVEDTTVQVNVWRQKVSDDKYAADADKTYDYVKDYSYSVSATSGKDLDWLRTYDKLKVPSNAATTDPYYANRGKDVEEITDQGFHLHGNSKATATVMSTSKVKGDGSTVVNVYYDRDLITFNFYTHNDPNSFNYTETTSNAASPDQYAFVNGTAVKLDRQETPTWLWTPDYTYSVAEDSNTNTPQFAIVNGEYVQLTRESHETNIYGWRQKAYTSYLIENSYDKIFYKAKPGVNAGDTISASYAEPSGYTADNPPSPNDTTKYYSRDKKNSTTYYLLESYVKSTTTTYTWQLNGADYTGTRYTRTSGGSYTGKAYTRSGSSAPYTYAVIADDDRDNDPQKYGVDRFGGHVSLTGADGVVVTWLAPVYAQEYYADANGEYGKIGDEYVLLEKTLVSRSYQRTGNKYTQTTNNSGEQYGVVRGAIVQLSQYYNSDWYYGSSWYYGDRYTRSDSSNATYNGQRYKLISGTAGNGQSGFDETSEVSGDGLFGRDGNNTYFELQVNETYSYSYNGQPYDGDHYSYGYHDTGRKAAWTGTRYTRTGTSSWGMYKQFTGLYGQTLKQNGYTWDETYDWYSSKNDYGNTGGTRTTFLDAFLPTERTTTVNFYASSTSSGSQVIFYKQDLNSDGTVGTTYTEANRVNTSNGSFYISDKYDGFEAYQYRVDNGSWEGVGTKSGGYYNNGNTVRYDSTLEIRFKRKLKSITFTTQYPDLPDLWAGSTATASADTKTVENIPYGANIKNYGPVKTGNVTHWHFGPVSAGSSTADVELTVPPHYIFKGWFADSGWRYDEETSVPYDFNSTMPDGDVIVYGKWEPEEFLIRIDPDGGVVDHVNHWGANEFELTADWTGKYNGSKYSTYEFNTFRPTTSHVPDAVPAMQKYNPNQATFFWNYYNQTISEYGAVTRDYVEITQTEANAMRTAYANATTDEERKANTVYYYLNTQYFDETEQMKIHSDARNALYLKESEVAEYFAFFRNVCIARYGSCAYDEADFESWKRDFLTHDKNGNLIYYRYRNNKESYEMLGWYQVFYDDNGEETGMASTPYNFADPTKGKVTLRARWRLDGGYIIQYTPEQTVDGKVINGDMAAWTDPVTAEGTYTDDAKTNIYRQPDNITEDGDLEKGANYDFIGWRLVSPKLGAGGEIIYVPLEGHQVYQPGDKVYQPGDEWNVKSGYADANSIIHMQAVYQLKSESVRRPERIVNLTLDANAGYLLNSGGTELTADANLDWDGPGVATMNASADQIHFGDIQTNTAVRLYQYATELEQDEQGHTLTPAGKNYFKHDQGFLLIGFDKEYRDDGTTLDKGSDYVATYPADSVISLKKTDSQTLYAVWEPMVYITFKNETKDTAHYINGGPVTFGLSSTNGQALTIVNIKNGLYDRTPLDSVSSITLEEGDEMTFAVPLGKDKDITISGTNTLGPGSILHVNSKVEGSYTPSVRTGDPDEVLADNNKTFSLTDILVEQKQGVIVTFTSEMHDRTLVFNQNFGSNTTTEAYFSHEELAAKAGSVTMPYTNTNFGFELQGWALTPDETTPLFPVLDANDNPYKLEGEALTDFFGNEQIKTLYAVWKGKEEAGKVYVYKTVPSPGSAKEEFTFKVKMFGRFKYQYLTSPDRCDISLEGTFKLKGNEYAVVQTEQYLGESSQEATPAKAWLQYTITVYHQNDQGEWVEDTERRSTQRVEAAKADIGEFMTEDYAFSIEETPLVQYYTPSLGVTSQLTKMSESMVQWNSPEAGGTARFTNTHVTHSVMVKKTLLPSNATEGAFSFSASYKLKNDEDVSLGTFQIPGGYQHELTGIPAGAVLTIAETANDDYKTAAAAQSGATDQDNRDTVFKFDVTQNDTVTFTNTQKSFPVKIALKGYDGTTIYNNVNADFTLEKGTASTVFTNRRVNSQNNVVYNTGTVFPSASAVDGELYIGSYTLKETWLEESYMALTPEFSFTVTKDEVTMPQPVPGVVLEHFGTEYILTITNRKAVTVNISKRLNDPLVSTTLDFDFKVSYQLGENDPVLSTVTVTSGDTSVVKVPMRSKLVIEEDGEKIVSEQHIKDRYTTRYWVDSGASVDGSSYTNDAVGANMSITFENSFKTSRIEVGKTVTTDDTSGTFHFSATLLVGKNPVKDYTLFDNDYTDDLKTDVNGTVTFDLVHNGTPQSLDIPIGAKLQIKETGAADDLPTGMTFDSYQTQVTPVNNTTNAALDSDLYTFDSQEKLFELSSVPANGLTVTFTNGIGFPVRVMLVKVGKVGENYEALKDVTLNVYTDAAMSNLAKGTVWQDNGSKNENYLLQDLQSAGGGVFFIGELPYGKYYVKETIPPDSPAGQKGYSTPANQHFEFTIAEGGVVEVPATPGAQPAPLKIVELKPNQTPTPTP